MAFKSIRKRQSQKRFSFKEIIKQEFDYDVDELDPYVDEQSPEIMEDLINASNLKSRVSVMDNVKGSKLIKIKTSQPSLQAAEACGWTPDGGIILTDVTLTTVRVKIQEEYCNEDLNDTWAQIENAAGANAQDESAPNFADTMIRYYIQRANELDENLMMNGDTASTDPNLVYYDGWVKRFLASDEMQKYYTSVTETTGFTSANAYTLLKGLDGVIPTVVKRHRATVGLEIIVGYETAQKCIDQIWNDKDYNAKLEFTDVDGELSFILPATTTRVRSVPSLDGTNYAFAVPYKYMFYGTDLKNDMDGFKFSYNETEELLRFSVKWRSGVNWIFPSYFARVRFTAVS